MDRACTKWTGQEAGEVSRYIIRAMVVLSSGLMGVAALHSCLGGQANSDAIAAADQSIIRHFGAKAPL